MESKNYSPPWCLLALLLLFSFGCSSLKGTRQSKLVAQSDGDAVPSWATMIDDPNVNYNDAVAAFEAFWKGKERPIQEDETFGAVENEEKEREFEERKQKIGKDTPAAKYAFEYKRFINWQREVENYVQPDGRILSADEKIELWKKEEELKKAQEKQ